ncbi:MAG: PGPGW domain-containing protein [Hoeflea sp.]|uniref:PGPGW domain-containing protein n=1 Tax=Hoeflea sp. TaxID=1940281 RepID=UPI0032983DCC
MRIGSRFFALPRRARTRIALGAGLVVGGVLGFLPVLGFWMIPLGLLVLSRDLPTARRWRRSLVVRMERRGTKRPRPKERAEKQAAESD